MDRQLGGKRAFLKTVDPLRQPLPGGLRRGVIDAQAQHKADGVIPDDIDAELAGQAVVGMLRQSGIVARRRDFGRDRLTDALVRLLLRGLGAH